MRLWGYTDWSIWMRFLLGTDLQDARYWVLADKETQGIQYRTYPKVSIKYTVNMIGKKSGLSSLEVFLFVGTWCYRTQYVS